MTTCDDYQLNMMAERPSRGSRHRAHANAAGASLRQPSADVTSAAMGRLEAETYKREWRASYRYRCHIEQANAKRERELLMKKIEQEAMAALEKTMREAGGAKSAGPKVGHAELRNTVQANEDDESDDHATVRTLKKGLCVSTVTAGRVAAGLIFAEMFDARPEVLTAIRTSAPVIVVDVPDSDMMDRVASTWKNVLFDDQSRLKKISGKVIYREDYDAVYLVVKEPPKAKDKANGAV